MAASEVHEVKKDAPVEGDEEKKQEVEAYTVDREKVCSKYCMSLDLSLSDLPLFIKSLL